MFDGQMDYAEMTELLDELDQHIEALRSAGSQLAINDKDYRVAVALETLKMRAEGNAVTLIRDIVRGDERIAELRCARGCAEANYKAELEAINSKKLRIRMISAQIDREWSAIR